MAEIHNQILGNLRVIELATVLAGPLTGRFFGEAGAQVIKVEPPGGDVTRSWKTKNDSHGLSSYFASANAHKQYITIDLKSAEGRDELFSLLEKADVFISNLLPAASNRLGLSETILRQKFPSLIIGIIEGYGNGSNRPAYDIVLQAEAGYLSMTGIGKAPARLPVAFIDVLAAHQLKEGILMALLNRGITGRGALVKISLIDAAIGSLANQAGNYLMDGTEPLKMGTLHPNIAPYGECFICLDGRQIVLAAGTQAQFEALCQICGLSTLLSDPRFANNALRVEHREPLMHFLQPVFLSKSSEHWNKEMQNAGVPAGIVKNLREVLDATENKHLIYQEELDGQVARSVKTLNFKIIS